MVMPEIISFGIYNSQSAKKSAEDEKTRETYMFEIELPIEKGGILYLDSEFCHIVPDVMIVGKPGQLKHIKSPFNCYYIHMVLREGVLYDALMNVPNFLKVGNPDNYKAIFNNMIRHSTHFSMPSKNYEIRLQSFVLELIYNLCEDAAKVANLTIGIGTNQNNITLIESVLSYIKNNLTEDLSLEKISEITHLSPIHFHNIFKTATGKTLRRYVEEQRIKKAVILLTTTDYTLTKIAFECGFSSQSYFSYVFKRKLKKTPREYVRDFYKRYEI